MVIAMLILVMVVLHTQVVSGAIIVVFLRTLKSLVQVELQHVKMAKEKIQVVLKWIAERINGALLTLMALVNVEMTLV